MDLQLLLTILLIFIELIAFAWLIIDIQKSKKKQDKIIELEHQILQVEHQILNLETNILETENNIIDEVKKLIKLYQKLNNVH
jgi:predicted subunit of tRNA(5-methylaminomethyl-2-thiouridylate) methyltransferase